MDVFLNADTKDEDLVSLIRTSQFCPSFIDDIDNEGNNILQVVITKSPHNIQTIACLLELRASLTKHYNHERLTALHMAVKQSNRRIVELIVRADASALNYHICSDQRTPLQMSQRTRDCSMYDCN